MNRSLFSFLAFIIFLLIASVFIMPVFANQPVTGTFTQVTVLVGVNAGTQFMTGETLHAKNSVSAAYQYGTPWGNSLISVSEAYTVRIDTATSTGSVLLHAVDVYATGTVEGIVNTKIIGRGPYTYLGPTFSFELGGRTGTIIHGATYIGGLTEGLAVKHGFSGDLEGIKIEATFTGVNIMVGPLAGVHVIEATGTYKLPS